MSNHLLFYSCHLLPQSYRPTSSLLPAIYKLLENYCMQNNTAVLRCFIDQNKALYSVDHKLLEEKNYKHWIQKTAHDWLNHIKHASIWCWCNKSVIVDYTINKGKKRKDNTTVNTNGLILYSNWGRTRFHIYLDPIYTLPKFIYLITYIIRCQIIILKIAQPCF